MRWLLKSFDKSSAAALSESLSLPPIVGSLLVQRGINDAEAARIFLNSSLDQLHSPSLMLGMQTAVERLTAAITNKEDMLIYGDYDVDGTVAVVILKTAIELCGGTVDFHVPHRLREGYGMKEDVIEAAASAGVRLIISVDTGIRAFAAAETARRVGVELIVTDHHLPENNQRVPDALAVVNPNQPGCTYPNKSLCGAGVAFKLAQALMAKVRGEAEMQRLLPSFIKMVAIATIADAVPLTGENRVFTKLGLDGLRRLVNPGLRALFEVAKVGDRPGGVSASDIGFRVAPRLNAAGRMDVAKDVIELFTTKDVARAGELAAKLHKLNAERQAEELRILAAMQMRVETDEELQRAFCLVVDGDGWHRGVIGICATRLVERYGKPTLVISRDGADGHGSGRSIAGFHLLDALEQESCRVLFTRFGGHSHAVGFGVPCENIAALRAAMDSYARTKLTAAELQPTLEIDAEIGIEEVTPKLLEALQRLEPYGQGNREPVFVTRSVRLIGPPRVLKEKHMKLRVAGQNGRAFDVLAWRMADALQPMNLLAGESLDLAFRLEENQHPDFGGLQLVLCDAARAVVAAIATA
ncbi:MAG: single-stranded-DNA-specific exonuclease RecJ [Terriglobales bacterium]